MKVSALFGANYCRLAKWLLLSHSHDRVAGLSLAGGKISYELNPIVLRKAKIVYNFGLSECNRVNWNFIAQGPSLSCSIKILLKRTQNYQLTALGITECW